MSDTSLRVAVIVASTREGRFAPTVAKWFIGQTEQREDLVVDLIDLAEHPPPPTLSFAPSDEVRQAFKAVTPRIQEADAYIVITPEYNHSFPAPLKTLIDWHYTQWQAKPVGFVSYGGLAGGLRAVEQLRPIFAELHAVTMRDVVSFHGAAERFEQDGTPKDPGACNGAAKVLLDQLAWWALALREAKEKRAYGG